MVIDKIKVFEYKAIKLNNKQFRCVVTVTPEMHRAYAELNGRNIGYPDRKNADHGHTWLMPLIEITEFDGIGDTVYEALMNLVPKLKEFGFTGKLRKKKERESGAGYRNGLYYKEDLLMGGYTPVTRPDWSLYD